MNKNELMMLEALALVAAVAQKMQAAPAEQAKAALEELGEFAAITVRVARQELQMAG